MSTKRYCDRCAREVDLRGVSGVVTLVQISHGTVLSRPHYDLCAECLRAVTAFMFAAA